MTLTELIERLEKAEGPNYALEVDIFKFFNPEYRDFVKGRGGLVHANDGCDQRVLSDVRPPSVTSSLDSAVALADRVVAKEGRKLICFFCAGGQLTPYNAEEGSPDYHPRAKIDNSVTAGWMAHVAFYNEDGTSTGHPGYSHGRTAPIALLLATLRALQSKGGAA